MEKESDIDINFSELKQSKEENEEQNRDLDSNRGNSGDSDFGNFPPQAEGFTVRSSVSLKPEGLTYSKESLHYGGEEEELWNVDEEIFEETKDLEEPCKSEVEETPSLVIHEKSENESGSSSEALSNVYSKLSPFNVRWSFGLKTEVGIINLTTKESFEVFYVSSHFGVIYNYAYNTMTFLPGHNYSITSIASDKTGRWLVTADSGEDTAIIIWDRMKLLPVWSLYNVFPGGVQCVALSPDSRFLAAVNCAPNYVLKFWMWTYGREEPDALVNIKSSFGRPKHIDFNHTNTEQFVITAEYGVIFCEWNSSTRQPRCHALTLEISKKKVGALRETIFLDDNHTALTSTSQGHVVVWCDVKYTEPVIPEIKGSIEKQFLKVVRLHKTGITSLQICDKVIASSAEDGTILFHDQNCHLLYWFPKLKVESLACISFNVDDISCAMDPFSEHFSRTYKQSMDEEVQNIFDYDDDEETESEESWAAKLKCEIPDPVDCTMELRPFHVRDLLFMTANGKIGYVSHKRKKVKYYLYKESTPVTAMDCHPNKHHLVVGNKEGEITVYEYKERKVLLCENFSSAVTALRYTRSGYYLLAGFQSGEVMELSPLLLHVKSKLESSKFSIEKVCLSPAEDYLAFYDQSSTVQVYHKSKKHNQTKKWALMGKYISHYKRIVDMLFEEDYRDPQYCRLFTLGEDRMLVEYDMRKTEEDGLKIINVIRVEQTAVPRCFIWMRKFYGSPHFLISNDEYKLKVYHPDSQLCKKTTLGPTADTPIRYMKVITDEDPDLVKPKMIYATDRHIGLQLLPPTGNPYEGIGMVASTHKLGAIAASYDHQHVFTVGVGEPNILMWEINSKSVEVAAALGGIGVEPFASLLEGGLGGFLFNEMEDFFYYAQLIHQGENPNIPRNVSKTLAVCEVPDLFRALGYFLTDYEERNLIHELQNLNYGTGKDGSEEITFEDCVKVFINHKPIRETSISEINEVLSNFADLSDPTDIIIERNELYKALEEKGEPMDHAEVLGYLCILLRPRNEENPLPHSVTLNDFAENVLGVDLTITEENVRQITHAFELK